MDERQEMQHSFFGKVGEPVPAVNPMELQRVWQITEDIRARHGNQQIGIDEGAYGPLTDCQAVRYRAMILWAMRYFSQNADQLRKEVKEPKDLEEVNTLERWLNTPVPTESVIKAMSAVPLTWPAIGSHGIPGFDVQEFARLCEAA